MMTQFLGGQILNPEQFHQSRMNLLRNAGITLFVDGGANSGEYAGHIRHSGYAGKIVSFEPLSFEFARLSGLASRDPGWECRHLALGEEDRIVHIHLAGNSYSSSLLPMLDRHLASAPDSRYTGIEAVNMKRLDNACSEFLSGNEKIYLKLDVQGYEMRVLSGAQEILRSTLAIEIELALVELYAGQTLCSEMMNYLHQHGFHLLSYEDNFVDPVTGEVLEINGIFVRYA